MPPLSCPSHSALFVWPYIPSCAQAAFHARIAFCMDVHNEVGAAIIAFLGRLGQLWLVTALGLRAALLFGSLPLPFAPSPTQSHSPLSSPPLNHPCRP